MRATKAYIAGAGTAAVMLAASLTMLAVVSAFVAFGSWPGQNAGGRIDQVVLADVLKPKPKKIAVRADAVQAARRAEIRAKATARPADGRRSGSRERPALQRGGGGPSPSPNAPQPSGGSSPAAGSNPPASAPAGDPVSTVRQQTQGVTENLQTTTRDVGTQVQDTVNGATGTVTDTVKDTAGSLLGH
ncbi:MAG TPA: hypothetical protein VE570_08505 [Thermoleophilaceae bacterium]|nr:hypothetical protein [Thermoleophilaceae bacterium]